MTSISRTPPQNFKALQSTNMLIAKWSENLFLSYLDELAEMNR